MTTSQPLSPLQARYALPRGEVFMSGIHALVRLPINQHLRDADAGKHTAGLVSGYRGSPLGGYDQALWSAAEPLKRAHVTFQPGVNEELAATAIWGSQQLGFAPPAPQRYDGVFGIWYGKGPGVDRCADVFKHANMAGTTPWGGAIAVAGDDHVAKSSTAAHQSDHIFKACGLPVFFPASVQEILDHGIHAMALSRFAGVWSGMKTIQDIVESSATVEVDHARVSLVVPDFDMPPGGLHIRWPDTALAQEARLFDHKWYAALAYIRANRLNHNLWATPTDTYGIMASGKAYNDVRQALVDMGLDEPMCRRIGLRLHKVGVVWPLEAQTTRDFAMGLREILVVEEKRQILEYQLKEELYNWRPDVRPDVLGKFDEQGTDHSGGEWSMPNPSAQTLLRANADLNPTLIARALAKRLRHRGLLPDGSEAWQRVQHHLQHLDNLEKATLHAQTVSAGVARPPWFCSGCPHNTSTQVPDGSRAMAGIGCHFMAIWMDRATLGFTQMGGEGVPWVGQQPFTDEPHVFANLGDGTYFHSGLLAIRQSIAAGINITYKLLYNDAVAMTGGQAVGERPEGHSVLQIIHCVLAEGVSRVVVVTDEPDRYQSPKQTLPSGFTLTLPPDVKVYHRDQLDHVQSTLRDVPGTTVLVYDQTCATEKRRRRKRGRLAKPATHVHIHPDVCEGCGDCGVKSNCLSVEPLETPLGRKRTINTSSCNTDLSCLKGFCPSFITVEGERLPTESSRRPPADWGELPHPSVSLDMPWSGVMAGIGGTGVITLGQLVGMAAHLDGRRVITQDAAGLAQKGGATWSHVQIAPVGHPLSTTKVPDGAASLLLACDPLVAAMPETLRVLGPTVSHAVLNSHMAPTAAFLHQRDWTAPEEACSQSLASLIKSDALFTFDAHQLAQHLLGDALYANPVLLGMAWQKGWLPVSESALLQAMTLNDTQVALNQQAFQWGRWAAHDPGRMRDYITPASPVQWLDRPSLQALIDDRARRLIDYQGKAYAQQYRNAVNRLKQAEQAVGRETLTRQYATQLYRLMAYKDEYEVARLLSNDHISTVLRSYRLGAKINYHLAPPSLSGAKEQKITFGQWLSTFLPWLAKLKVVRGSVWDVFGWTQERQQERQLIKDYVALVEHMSRQLTLMSEADAKRCVDWPEQIKGFGHVKSKAATVAMDEWRDLKEMLQKKQG